MSNLEDVFEEVASEEVAPEMEVDNSQETDVESEQVAEPSIGDDAIDEVDTLETEPTEAVEPDTDGWQTILEEHGDLQVPLQVDGQTIYRSLKDLPANAMMREDYSRKTAELSQA